MGTSNCIYNFYGKCCHKNAPIFSRSDCLGENNCDVIIKFQDLDNKQLMKLLAGLKKIREGIE